MGCTKGASYGFPGESAQWYIQGDTCLVYEHEIVSYLGPVLRKSSLPFVGVLNTRSQQRSS